MLSDEWLSRYGLLENFNASVTRTRTRTRTRTGTGTGTGTGTWTTEVTAIALCTSCSRAKNDHSPNLPKMFFFKYMHPKTPKCLLAPELHVNNALSPQTPKTPGGIPVICSSNRSFQLYKLYLFFLSLQTAYSREKKIKEINYYCVLIVSIKQTRGRPPWSSG